MMAIQVFAKPNAKIELAFSIQNSVSWCSLSTLWKKENSVFKKRQEAGPVAHT
jgi:hypothetical protein